MAQDSSNIWLECLESRDKTSLCELCQGLTIAKLRPPNFYRHAENRAALQSSAENCRLCAIIERAIWRDGCGKEYGPQLQFEGAVDNGWFFSEEERAERDSCAVKLALVPDDWAEESGIKASKKVSGFAYVGVWLKSKYMATDLHLVVEEGDPLGRKGCATEDFYVSGRTIVTQDIPQTALFDVVRAWMYNCRRQHKVCALAPWDESPLLPSRVIDVTQDGLDPRLIVSDEGQRGRYAALSHCWGGLHLLQTKVATLVQYQDNIPMDELPKSFKDAITIARRLNIPFLWIDSLCIVQDSEQDWHHESALMSSIYCNSVLTISATGALDGSQDCFIPEAHSEIVQLPQKFSDTDGTAYVTGSRLGTYGPPWSDKVASGPLFQRAWALQERCLSRRILHCCRGQWVWECCEKIEAQFGYSEERSNAWHPAFLGRIGAMKRAYNGVYEFENYDDDNDDDKSEDAETAMEDSEQRAAQSRPADRLVRLDIENVTGQESNIEESEETALARLENVHIETSSKDGEEQQEPASQSFVVSLMEPPNGRSTYVVDLRTDASKPAVKPILLDRPTDNDLYDFLEVASRNCRYKIWYDLVTSYTSRSLTKSSDKLPAIAGLAAAIHEITKDSYLAGHWRLELERSLFWRTDQEVVSPEPARCHEYRAPSWAWPSMEGGVWWNWPDLSPGVGEEAPLKIVSVGVELIAADDNPFGPVAGGGLTVEVRTTWVRWDEDMNAYVTSGLEDDAAKAVDPSSTQGMLILNGSGNNVGSWECDDTLNTVFPATKIKPGITLDDLRGRRIPFGGYARWAKKTIDDIDLAERFTALPPELLCVRGPTRYNRERIWPEPGEDEQEARYKIDCRIEALLLARTEEPSGKVFRRVGAADFSSWDCSQEVAETITII